MDVYGDINVIFGVSVSPNGNLKKGKLVINGDKPDEKTMHFSW
jgi:hypothetical protein